MKITPRSRRFVIGGLLGREKNTLLLQSKPQVANLRELGYLGSPHVLSIGDYIKKWKNKTENSSAVLFLFAKEYGKNEYEFNGLSVSEQLENEHLFEKVTEFINEHLSGDNKTIVANGSKYLARAITPVWTEEKQNVARELVKEGKYQANHINYFHGSWKSTFIDIKPISTVNQNENLLKVWFLKHNKNNIDTIKPNIAMYADATIFKGEEFLIEGEGYRWYFLATILNFPVTNERILLFKPKNANIESQTYIFNLIEAMQKEQKYSSTKNVSEWDWSKDKGEFSLNSTFALENYKEGDKFELIKVDLNEKYMEGEKIPIIHPWHPRTFCNVYASDLTRDILFPNVFTSGANYAPWGAHQSAAKLHDTMKNNTNGKFKSVTFDEAWQYTNAGYVVYLTAYNRRYYNGTTSNPYAYSGHIATCYYTDKYQQRQHMEANIIQAGGSCGVFTFKSVWAESIYGTDNEYVKANLYLGYILK